MCSSTMADDYEQTLTVLDECFVFKIPPRTSSEGHKYVQCRARRDKNAATMNGSVHADAVDRASNWDLEHHIWKGRCRVTVCAGDMVEWRGVMMAID